VRVIVGQTDCSYLNRYRSNPQIEIIGGSTAEWAEFKNCRVHQRASWNYWRALTLGLQTPDADGLLVFEDDVLPAIKWKRRLCEVIGSIEKAHGIRYVLALYTTLTVGHLPESKYIRYPVNLFFGTQGMYYPESVLEEFAGYLEEKGVRLCCAPYDLILQEYLSNLQIPLFATIPCLVQHVGEISTGLGDFHQARHF
jgi:hypothetical protein